MGKLISEFEKKRRVYLIKKRQFSKKSEYERELRIKKFLRYCESKGIKRIKDITDKEYRAFVGDILSGKSVETKRKYLLALKEFFTRAHLPVRVNVQGSVNRTKEKKLNKILEILDIEITEEQKEKILNLL